MGARVSSALHTGAASNARAARSRARYTTTCRPCTTAAIGRRDSGGDGSAVEGRQFKHWSPHLMTVVTVCQVPHACSPVPHTIIMRLLDTEEYSGPEQSAAGKRAQSPDNHAGVGSGKNAWGNRAIQLLNHANASIAFGGFGATTNRTPLLPHPGTPALPSPFWLRLQRQTQVGQQRHAVPRRSLAVVHGIRHVDVAPPARLGERAHVVGQERAGAC